MIVHKKETLNSLIKLQSQIEESEKLKDEDLDDDTIDDHEFNLAIKEDGNYNNQINNMITDIYKANNPNPTVASQNEANTNETVTPSKRSNLKAVSMFDNTKSITQEEFNNRKRVKFSNDQNVEKANELVKKRKLPGEQSEGSRFKSSRSSSSGNQLELTK